jgi:hypothetical protein
VTDHPSTATWVFDDPRQAVGWLTSRWADPLIVVLVGAVLLGDRATDALGTSWSAASTILLLGVGALNVRGYWVSSEARPRLREAARQRELSWWERDRFGAEQAADRLGWATEPVIWTTRALTALAAVATVAAAAVLALRWL